MNHLLFICFTILTLACNLWSATGETASHQIRIIVAFDSPADHAAILPIMERDYDAKQVHSDLDHGFVAYVLDRNDFSTMKRDERILDRIRYIEKDQLRHFGTEQSGESLLFEYVDDPMPLYTPNDPRYSNQWAPECIDLDLAWNVEQGDHSVIVAVLDSGIDIDHEDLQANYIPSLARNYTNQGGDYDIDDGFGHGTHCAGIIGATIDNGLGIAGAVQVRLMILRVCNDNGLIYTSWVCSALYDAADNGARVASMSFGGFFSQTEDEACQYCWDRGMILAASAGNEDTSRKSYPAAHSSVIGVGALGNDWNPNKHCQTRAGYSNYNSSCGDLSTQNVELMAPGTNISSTIPDNDYVKWSGTSMASPYVAAVAAGYFCYRPDLTNRMVRHHMNLNADDWESGYDCLYWGNGRVDAWPFAD